MATIDWNTAIQYARLVKLAEDAGPAGNDDLLRTSLPAQNYAFVQTFFGNDLATDIDPKEDADPVAFGFLAISAGGELVVSIRGTDTIFEWLQDAEFLLIPSPIPGTRGWTEDGFTSLYKSLRIGKDAASQTLIAAIEAKLASGAAKTVTVCGHSLGGALTTFVALDVAVNSTCKDPLVYSYASPRTGDPTFVHNYNLKVPSTFRVANRNDFVPKFPPILPIPYDHVDTEFLLVPAPGQVKLSIACMHHLTTYLFLMAQLAKVGGFPLDADCKP
jgi:hypothetical protein